MTDWSAYLARLHLADAVALQGVLAAGRSPTVLVYPVTGRGGPVRHVALVYYSDRLFPGFEPRDEAVQYRIYVPKERT